MINHLMSILIIIFLDTMEKPRILPKTVPAIELQLPISSTLESGMNRCFQIH